MGFAYLFRPMYAGANMGHRSSTMAYFVERFFFAGFEAAAVFRVFSFFSRLNFQAVRNAPASRSSFAAPRRT
jgi:hypothetical protein